MSSDFTPSPALLPFWLPAEAGPQALGDMPEAGPQALGEMPPRLGWGCWEGRAVTLCCSLQISAPQERLYSTWIG